LNPNAEMLAATGGNGLVNLNDVSCGPVSGNGLKNKPLRFLIYALAAFMVVVSALCVFGFALGNVGSVLPWFVLVVSVGWLNSAVVYFRKRDHDARLSLVGVAAFIAVPLEIFALLGFSTVPIDVGFAVGTSQWMKAWGEAGVWIHYPLLMLNPSVTGELGHFVLWFSCFLIGSTELFLLILSVFYGCRFSRRLVAKR